MSRILLSVDDLRTYGHREGRACVTAFESGTVMLTTDSGGMGTTHHLTTAGARQLADALLTAAQTVEIEAVMPAERCEVTA